MKYFLKIKLLKDKNKAAILFFVPDFCDVAIYQEPEYKVGFSESKNDYSFSIRKGKTFLGKYSNPIKPKQIIEWQDGNITFVISLVSVFFNKSKAEKYFKSIPEIRVKDMEHFYSYVGDYKKSNQYTSRHPRGPLYPTSGMDPDLRAEYAKKGNDDNKE